MKAKSLFSCTQQELYLALPIVPHIIQITHDFQSKNGMARQWVCHPLWCIK